MLRQGKRRPASLVSGTNIPFALITVATPARATLGCYASRFRPATLRSILRWRACGVFTSYRSLKRRLDAYSSSSQSVGDQVGGIICQRGDLSRGKTTPMRSQSAMSTNTAVGLLSLPTTNRTSWVCISISTSSPVNRFILRQNQTCPKIEISGSGIALKSIFLVS
jgi:hypothetical protein